MTCPSRGKVFIAKKERENIQRHLEEFRAERKENRLGLARDRELGEWEKVKVSRDIE